MPGGVGAGGGGGGVRRTRALPPVRSFASVPHLPASFAWRAGGRVITSLGNGALKVVSKVLDGITTAPGGFSVGVIASVSSAANNQSLLDKTTSLTGNGFRLMLESDDGGVTCRPRFLMGMSGAYWDVIADSGNSVPLNTHCHIGVGYDGSTKPLLIMGPLLGAQAVVNFGAATNAGTGSPVSEGVQPLYGFNDAGLAAGTGCTAQWIYAYRAPELVGPQWQRFVDAITICTAGDFSRGIAMARALQLDLLMQVCNDGTVIDYSQNVVAGALQGTHSTGTTLENDSSGVKLNRLFAPTQFEDDAEILPAVDGLDYRDQPLYRHTSTHARKRFTWTGTGFTAVFHNSLDLALPDQGVLTYRLDGVDTGILTSATIGANVGAVSGLSSALREVTFQNGAQSHPSTDPLPAQGTFLKFAYFDAAATEITPAVRTRELFGDSESTDVAFMMDPPQFYSAAQVYRNNATYVGPSGNVDGVVWNGYGGKQLSQIFGTASLRSNWARRAAMDGAAAEVFLALGANDKLGNTMTAAAWQTMLQAGCAALLDRTDFTGLLVLADQVINANESSDGIFGTMDDARAAVSTTVTNLQGIYGSTRVRYVSRKTALAVGDLIDGSHTDNTGELKLDALFPGWVSLSSGTTFSDSVAETLTATASQTAAATFAPSLPETLTAAETETAAATFVGTVAETRSAAETNTGSATFVVAASDTLTAAESQAGPASFAGSQPETLTAAETQTSLATFVGAQSETVAATDAQTGLVTFLASRAETGAVTDTDTASATIVVAQAETGAVADTNASSAVFAGVDAETLTASASQDANVSGAPATYNVSVTEALAATSTETALATFVAARAESVTSTDTQAGSATFAGLRSEALTASESAATGASTWVGDVAESLAVADIPTGAASMAVLRAEILALIDSSTAQQLAAVTTVTLLGTFTQVLPAVTVATVTPHAVIAYATPPAIASLSTTGST